MIGGGTQVCCIIGDPVAHSHSPLLHNAGYQALGLDFVYVPLRAGDIGKAVAGIRALGITGASITMPYKAGAIRFVDEIDRISIETGVLNTIVNKGGVLTGYNTDYSAALRALAEVVTADGKRVVVLGAGGVAAAIALGLRRTGAKLVILNRSRDRAEKLAEMVDAEEAGGLEKIDIISSADVLVNATPVGMWPQVDSSPVPGELLHDKLTVFDTVYYPKKTRLLAAAEEKGCAVVYGYKMLLYQAATQFELFTGQEAPLDVMEQALTEALG